MGSFEERESDLLMKVQGLEVQLQESEGNLILSATYGKELLDSNQELQEKLAQQAEEYGSKLMDAEQDLYSQKMKLERMVKSEEGYQVETDSLRENIDKLKNEHYLREAQFSKSETHYKCQISNLEHSLQLSSLEKQKLETKIKLLETQIEEMQMQLDSPTLEDSFSDDIRTLLSKNTVLTHEKQQLECQVSLLMKQLDELKEVLSKSQDKWNDLVHSFQDTNMELRDAQASIKEFQKQNTELTLEISALKATHSDPNQKGNSLFGELEDRRQKAERAYKILEMRAADLASQNKLKSNQLMQLRIQMGAMLGQSAGKASSAYVEHLETSLYAARKRIKELALEIQKNYHKESEEDEITLPVPMANDSMNLRSGKVYSLDCLEALVSHERQEKEKVKRELQQQKMVQILENEKLNKARKQVYELEKQLQCSKVENSRLRLQICEIEPTLEQKPDAPAMSNPSTSAAKKHSTILKENQSRNMQGSVHFSDELRLDRRKSVSLESVKQERDASLSISKANVSVRSLVKTSRLLKTKVTQVNSPKQTLNDCKQQ